MTEARIGLAGETLTAMVQRKGDEVVVDLDGQAFTFKVAGSGPSRTVTGEGGSWVIERHGGRILLDGAELPLKILGLETTSSGAGAEGSAARVRPPMTGRLESLRVKVGQTVQKGDVLFVLEAMKMLNEVRAPVSGTVLAVHAQQGATLETGKAVLDIGPA